MKREKKAPIVGIKFEMMNINDVRPMLVSDRINSGRFGELKEGILEQVQNARNNQSVVFASPTDDIKEIVLIRAAITSALSKTNKEWVVRYSQKHKKFLIVHKGRLNWGGKNRVSKDA